jgi:hypothetical protein
LGGKSSGASPSATAKVPKSKSITTAKSDVPNATGSAVLRPVAVRENIARRDPFSPLIGRETTGGGGLSSQNLPPGKPGLLIRIESISFAKATAFTTVRCNISLWTASRFTRLEKIHSATPWTARLPNA